MLEALLSMRSRKVIRVTLILKQGQTVKRGC